MHVVDTVKLGVRKLLKRVERILGQTGNKLSLGIQSYRTSGTAPGPDNGTRAPQSHLNFGTAGFLGYG